MWPLILSKNIISPHKIIRLTLGHLPLLPVEQVGGQEEEACADTGEENIQHEANV